MQKYEGRCEQIIEKTATTVKLVDECGNAWDCVLMFGSTPGQLRMSTAKLVGCGRVSLMLERFLKV
jgi:hypothetical protein